MIRKMANHICDQCYKIVPVCASCKRSLEKIYSDRETLPLLGYCSENNTYGRYLLGYTDSNLVYCKSCQRTHSNCYQITNTHYICVCEHHIEN